MGNSVKMISTGATAKIRTSCNGRTAMFFQPAEAPSRPNRPEFVLPFGMIFWRVALVVALVGEWKILRFLTHLPKHIDPGRKILAFFYFSPKALFLGFLIGAIAAVVCDLVFRLMVRPRMVAWYNPRPIEPPGASPLLFHLEPGERVVFEIPARRVEGRKTPAGTLVRTDRRVAFVPFAWHVEGWSQPVGDLAEVRVEPVRRRVLGWVKGYPEHLILVGPDDIRERFVVADPVLTLERFAASEPVVLPGRA